MTRRLLKILYIPKDNGARTNEVKAMHAQSLEQFPATSIRNEQFPGNFLTVLVLKDTARSLIRLEPYLEDAASQVRLPTQEHTCHEND
jgi:hypothetical protein